MSDERVSEELHSGIDRMGDAAKGAVGKLGQKATEKLRSKARKMAANALKVVGKVLVNTMSFLVSVLSTILAVAWPFLLAVLGLIALKEAYNYLFYDSRVQSGTFQKEDKSVFADVIYNEDKTIAEIDSTFESDLAALFYTRYAQQSYFYYVDDAKELKQAGTQSDALVDKENRETLFLLNPQLLSVLDQELNGQYKMPEQFIKPVYHECEEKSEVNDGEPKMQCTLKALTDEDGNLVAESTKYGDADTKEDYRAQQVYEKTDEKINGVWDWGLSPIIHYKSFTEKSFVDKLYITSVSILKDGKMVSINPNELTEEDKTKFGYDKVFNNVAKRTNLTHSDEKEIPGNKLIYIIDNVITFAGEITNRTKKETVVSGSFSKIETHEYKEWTSTTDSNIIYNVNIDKKVYKNGVPVGKQVYENGILVENKLTYKKIEPGTNTTKGTPPEELTEEDYRECRILSDPDYVNTGRYDIAAYQQCIEDKKHGLDPGTEDVTVRGVWLDDFFVAGDIKNFTFEYEKTYELEYSVGGTIYTDTLTYSEENPDTSKLVSTTYLEDYIEHYSAFVEAGKDVYEYGCYNTTEEDLKSIISGGYLDSLESWNAMNMTQTQAVEKLSKDKLILDKVVSSPEQCANNQIVLRQDGGEMTSFNFEDTPTLQKLLSASIMGYDLTKDSDYVYAEADNTSKKSEEAIEIEPDAETLDAIRVKFKTEKPNNSTKTYAEIIKETSEKYRVDETLLTALIIAQNKGNFSNTGNTETTCLKSSLGCGSLKIKYDFEVMKYFDYKKNIEANVILSSKDFMDAETSIDILGAVLQQNLEKYDLNYLMAIQAMDTGEKMMNRIVSVAALGEGYAILDTEGAHNTYPKEKVSNTEWVSYRDYVYDSYSHQSSTANGSNINILEDTLTYIPSSYGVRVWNKKDNSYKNQSWSFLTRENNQVFFSAAAEITNNAIKVYEANKTNFSERWDVLFMGQKSYDEGSYDLNSDNPSNSPKKALYIEGPVSYDGQIDKIIQLILAYAEGESMQYYEGMTMADYKVRIVNMFQIGGRFEYAQNYDITQLIPTGNVSKLADNFYLTRGYGYAIDPITGKYGYYEDVEVGVGPGSKVYSLSDGVVDTVKKLPNEKYQITISHVGTIFDQETGEPVEGKENSETKIIYTDIVETTLKQGDNIASGSSIGKTSLDDETIYIEMYQDGVLLNSEAIIEYVMVKYDLASIHFGKVSKYSDSWIAPVVKRFHLNDGTWESTFGGRRIHMGVDIGFTNEGTLGQKLVAPISGTVIYTNDGCPLGYIGSKCGGGLGNSVVLAGEVDGITHIVIFMHMNQNSVAVSKGQAVQQGTHLGDAGSSGNSSGPHLHYEIIQMEDYTVDDVINYYKSTSDYLFTNGYGYSGMKSAGTYICTQTRNDFCRIRPEEKHGWVYDHGKTSYEPDITTPR